MLILGIDPGLDGALAFYNPTSGALDVYDMPTLQKTKRVVNEYELARLVDCLAKDVRAAVLEQVGARPGEGAVGAFSFGRGYGVLRGILSAHFIRIHDVSPQAWKRAHKLTGLPKAASCARATELFPRHSDLFNRAKDNGRADAACLAHYGAHNLQIEEHQ